MLEMSRLKWVLLVAFVLLLAVEPLVHTHPIGSDTTCAICAAGNPTIAKRPPAIAAPRQVVWVLTADEIAAPVTTDAPTVPSRAPPTA